jgi:hypothetical protein
LEDFGARLSIRIVEEASTGAFDLRLGAFWTFMRIPKLWKALKKL